MDIFDNMDKKILNDFNSVVNSNNLTYWSIRKAPAWYKKPVLLNVSFKKSELDTEIYHSEKEFDTIMEAVEYFYNFLKSV